MTKFILHGGGEGQGEKEHDAFFREIIDNLPNKAKVLCVYFAVPDESVKEKHKVYVDFFKRNNTDRKEIELKVASKDNFTEELRWADAIYFRGGETIRLLEQVKNYQNFKEELLKKKLVAGSSAGVYFLSNYAYSAGKDILYTGLGVLPIKSNCHYEKGKDLSKLDKLPGKLVLLREGEFVVVDNKK
jgi:peptidase E